MKREKFGSRLGFILISAGCAIGLGNVWRFPYITGQYGGAAFVLIYLLFLLILGLPIMVMEFSVGRASRSSVALSFDRLEPLGTKWHWYKWFGMAGNYLLMMFYTTIGGWLLLYHCCGSLLCDLQHRAAERRRKNHKSDDAYASCTYDHSGGTFRYSFRGRRRTGVLSCS